MAEFFGVTLRLRKPSEFAFMEFAEIGDSVDESTTAIPAALLRLAVDSVEPDDVKLFRTTARKNRAGARDLLPLIADALRLSTGRPTVLPSVSTDGQGATPTSSTAGYVSEALAATSGRPDLQLMVLEAQEARAV